MFRLNILFYGTFFTTAVHKIKWGCNDNGRSEIKRILSSMPWIESPKIPFDFQKPRSTWSLNNIEIVVN